MKKLLSFLLVLSFCLSFATFAVAEDTIKIAFVGPMTGDNAEYGQYMQESVQIAIDEWNAKGGVLNRQIEMVSFDDKNTSEEAASIAEKIVGDESICAVIGHFSSGVAMTGAQIYQEGGIALVNGSAAHIDFSSIGDCIFRNNAIYSTDANSFLQVVMYLGVEKFGMLHPNSDAGVSITSEVQGRLEEYGDKYPAELVTAELYNEGTVDFNAFITKFMDAGCEVIVSTATYSALAPFVKQYKEKDPDIKIIGSAATFSQEFIDLAGEDANGVCMPTSFFYESEKPIVQAFSEEFLTRMGANPNTFCAQVYDAANMIFLAIEEGQSASRADIVENLYKVTFDGCSGNVYFDEQGDCPKTQVLLEIVDGKYTEIPDVMMSRPDWEATYIFNE